MEIVADRTERLYKALQKFIYHVDRLTAEEDPGGTGFHREYRDLREISIRNKDSYEATHGKIPINIRKNRYKDIVPYDSTRVTLSEKPGIPGSDYINANFILDAHQREGYIASQGPLPHTLEDFWRMISEYKVKVVMMACREVEAGKKKCAQYWVEEGSEKGRFGEYEVACVGNEQLADDCDERHLQLITGDSIQEVYQYHYTGWPDHGIPDDIDVILEMIKRMRDIRSKDPDHAPVVVHCRRENYNLRWRLRPHRNQEVEQPVPAPDPDVPVPETLPVPVPNDDGNVQRSRANRRRAQVQQPVQPPENQQSDQNLQPPAKQMRTSAVQAEIDISAYTDIVV